MGVTRNIATFVQETTFEKIPAQAISTAKDLILDTIGVALAASVDPGAKIAIQYTRDIGASPVSSVIGGGLKTGAADAAFCNGLLAHALEYEDAWPEATHPSSVTLSAALAVAEQCGRSGRELIESYIVGLEVLAKLRTSTPTSLTQAYGWRNSGVYGPMGAAAAASKALGLDVKRIRWALGIASCGAGGLARHRGVMAKWYCQGNAARQGVLAALLAKDGFTADEDIIEGPRGFMDMFHHDGRFNLTKVAEGLGKPFHIVTPGVSIRKYACAYFIHGPIDTLLYLLQTLKVSYEDVDEIVVPVTPEQLYQYDIPSPRSGALAKFTLNLPLAVALRYGRLHRDDFTDERVADPEIQEAIKKVKFISLTPAEIPGDIDPRRYQAGIILRLKDGREFAHRLNHPSGRYDDPTPKGEFVLPKFRENAILVLKKNDVERCIELVQHLEELKDLGNLTELLRA